MNDEQLSALRSLIDYTMENEQDHYEECKLNNPDEKDIAHIYRDAVVVLAWLDEDKKILELVYNK